MVEQLRDNDNISCEVGTPLGYSNLCALGISSIRKASFRSGCHLRTLQKVRVVRSLVRDERGNDNL
jgi:hypothetical protein